MDQRARDAAEACGRLLGEAPIGWEDPGGQRRKSTRLFLDGRSVIATRRSTRARADLEMNVLRRLKAEDAPVPAVLAFEGRWLIQEDIGGERLSRRLRRVDKAEALGLQDAALASLDAVHGAAARAGLAPLCRVLGDRPGWIAELSATPARLGAFLGLEAPPLEVAAVARALARPATSFVKWDARPPNAVCTDDGRIAWFDWEHCGRRHRLDDLIWFLGDESIIDRPKDETALLNRWVPRFDEGGYPMGAAEYIMTAGALHCAVRLAIRVGNAARELRPDDWRQSLDGGRIGALPASATRLARRGARWAGRSAAVRPLEGWYRAVLERFSAA